VSNRKLACRGYTKSGYQSNNLSSNVFASAPKDSKYNPMSLKFDKPGLNNKAKPEDNDVLNQKPQKKRGIRRKHQSVDLEFKKPRNRFEKFYFAQKRSVNRCHSSQVLKYDQKK